MIIFFFVLIILYPLFLIYFYTYLNIYHKYNLIKKSDLYQEDHENDDQEFKDKNINENYENDDINEVNNVNNKIE